MTVDKYRILLSTTSTLSANDLKLLANLEENKVHSNTRQSSVEV